MPLVDSHCHLDFDAFNLDREAVVSRARSNGVTKILNPAIDLATGHEIILLADKIPELYAGVGVHPNDTSSWGKNALAVLRELAEHPKVVAIGEIGLDYYRDHTPVDEQKKIFRQQLGLAGELELPVIIHNREATHDLLGILKDWVEDLSVVNSPLAVRPGVLHSFSADLEAAETAIGMGFFVGITGPVTFRRAATLHEVVANVPLERVLIETDAPFLTPHPYRGKRNEPAYVRFVAQKIAEIHGLNDEEVADITTRNSNELFLW